MLPLLRILAPSSAVVSLLALALVGSLDRALPAAPATEPPAEAPAHTPDPGVLAQVAEAQVAEAPAPDAVTACPSGMVLVEGNYCPKVEQKCLRWLDGQKGRFGGFRCAEYAPSRCLSAERRPMRYCIDRDEHTRQGESLPDNHASLRIAEKTCAAEGKRACRESEWNFACEGPEMRPYPYGFQRDASACNADRADLTTPEGKLIDHRAPPGSHPRCVSPFGVRDMAGNLEEMVARDRPGPTEPAMKGAYWQPSRNHCRAAQTKHDAWYHGAETGFRCCADAPAR